MCYKKRQIRFQSKQQKGTSAGTEKKHSRNEYKWMKKVGAKSMISLKSNIKSACEKNDIWISIFKHIYISVVLVFTFVWE